VTAILEVTELTVHHGQLPAVQDMTFAIGPGEVVAMIGANGAGKSTLLRTIAGLHLPSRGRVVFGGRDITRAAVHERVAAGVSLVLEGRRLFGSLSVEENLLAGMYCRRKGPWTIERVVTELFPWIADRRRQPASQLSGGEQQAVAIGRALVSNPRLLLLDELSLGLSPIAVRRIYAVFPELVSEGLAILLVEQDVGQAMRAAGRIHCLLEGRETLVAATPDLTLEQVEKAYFGTTAMPPEPGGAA
jgi:branched-chain amino acid transport system ATP-binding protein